MLNIDIAEAKNKASNLGRNQMIRLSSDASINYWLYNLNDVQYIGSFNNEPMPPALEGVDVFDVDIKNWGACKIQKL